MTPQDYSFLQKFLKEKSGLVLSNDKQYLIESRLMPIARKAGLKSIEELIRKIQGLGDRSLQTAVVEAMTTNESFFFRDKTPFEHFSETIIPHLVRTRKTGRVRVWCAAASTGQEPYSLAMALRENAAKLGGLSFEIIATDISHDVLEKARAGFYSQFEVQRGLPVQLLLKHFKQHGEMWQISPEIRSMVQYKFFNLLDSFAAMGQFDVIFCRNVLIYFDQATKIDVMQRLAKQLPQDGYLLLGAAETVVGLTNAFQAVPGKRGLYCKPGVAGASTEPARMASAGGSAFGARAMEARPGAARSSSFSSSRLSSIPGGKR